LFLFLAFAAAPLAGPAAAADSESLSGKFLVAKSSLSDPNFVQTVIYMCRHDRTGAFGLVINRAIGTVPFAELARGFGIDSDDQADVRVRQGGPVELGSGFIVHSPDYVSTDAICAGGGVTVTSDLDVVRAIARGEGPERRLFFFGYAGWGPGQVENEIKHDSWDIVPGDPEMIFDEDLDGSWHRALKRRGVDL
jgi:putative transcriptional regulator